MEDLRRKEEMFGEVYDGMNHNFAYVQEMMADIYGMLLKDSSNKTLEKILYGLGDVSENIIKSQVNLTNNFCPDMDKDRLLDSLDEKSRNLKEALGYSKERLK